MIWEMIRKCGIPQKVSIWLMRKAIAWITMLNWVECSLKGSNQLNGVRGDSGQSNGGRNSCIGSIHSLWGKMILKCGITENVSIFVFFWYFSKHHCVDLSWMQFKRLRSVKRWERTKSTKKRAEAENKKKNKKSIGYQECGFASHTNNEFIQ